MLGKSMKNRILMTAALLSLPVAAHADFMGVFAGGGAWRADFSGDAINGSVNIENELGLSDDLSNYFYFAAEHPIPVLPNVRLERTSVADSGTGTLVANFEFAGQTFGADQAVNAEIDLTSTDVTLYYEIIDIGMDIDVGLTARIFSGDVIVDTATESLSGGIPMLYARGKFGLPFSGVYFGADINTIAYKDNQLTDYSLTLGWEIENFILPEFGIEGGYRAWTLDLDEDDFDVGVDMDLDGFFVNLTAHF